MNEKDVKIKDLALMHRYSNLEEFTNIVEVELAIMEVDRCINSILEHFWNERHHGLKTRDSFEACIDDVYKYAMEIEYKSKIIRKLADYYLDNVSVDASHDEMYNEANKLKCLIGRTTKQNAEEEVLTVK